jgi:hypothetical protein
MDIPMPDTITITRVAWSGNTYSGETAIASGVPAMILQEGEDLEMMLTGGVDNSQIVMIVGPTYDIEVGDLITDEGTSEVYRVVRPPSKHRRPTDWEDHHKEVVMERHEHHGN